MTSAFKFFPFKHVLCQSIHRLFDFQANITDREGWGNRVTPVGTSVCRVVVVLVTGWVLYNIGERTFSFPVGILGKKKRGNCWHVDLMEL